MATITRDKKGNVTVSATMREWDEITERLEVRNPERWIEQQSLTIGIYADEGALDLAGAARAAERDGAISLHVKEWS